MFSGLAGFCGRGFIRQLQRVLLFREKPPRSWLEKVLANLPAVLVDHAHLERKAASSALNLEKYPELFDRVGELNAIAIEELQHFASVLELLQRRGVPFGMGHASPWIRGLMATVRKGRRHQVIDHLICAALIEGRSCEKFQWLAAALRDRDPELAEFYGGLVESEGNHYAGYLIMARQIDLPETERRLKDFLAVDARLILEEHPYPILH